MPRILIIEDDDVLAALLSEKLGENGYEAISVGDGNQALGAMAGQCFDLVLADILLPEKEGLETIGEIKRRSGWGGGHAGRAAAGERGLGHGGVRRAVTQ